MLFGFDQLIACVWYALLDLKALHITCNSQVLPQNYCEVIDNFTRSWCNLSTKFNLSTTPKIHILTDHLCDYFDDSDLSLIKVTDEIIESSHQLFNKTMNKGYKVKDLSNPAHGVLLHNAVRTHNTYNMRIKMWVPAYVVYISSYNVYTSYMSPPDRNAALQV